MSATASIGIPYASCPKDASGNWILDTHICPVCGEHIKETKRKDWESYGNAEYAKHYKAKHEGHDTEATKMKIELRNVKHSPSLSQETAAYTADVWVNGVKRGTARNQGTGGADEIHPYSLEQELDAYAKTLPLEKSPWQDNGKDVFLPVTAELLLGAALDRALEGKRLQRMLKTKTVLVRGGKCYTVKTAPGAQLSLKPGDEVLNGLPFEEALTKYLKAASQ